MNSLPVGVSLFLIATGVIIALMETSWQGLLGAGSLILLAAVAHFFASRCKVLKRMKKNEDKGGG